MNLEIVDRIYEASFVPELWPDILHDIAALTDSKGGLLLSTREKSLNWTASAPVFEAFAEYLEGGWFRRCGRRVCLLEKAHAAFLTELDYWTEQEVADNEIYREFFRPRDLGWSAGTGLVMPTQDHIVFSIERSHQLGPIDDAKKAVLNGLRPDLARAAMVAARMGLKSAVTTKEAFEKLEIPSILIDLDGAAVDASDSTLPDAISIGMKNRVSLKDLNADKLLKNALAAQGKRGGVQSFAVRNEAGSPVFAAHVIPITRSAHDLFAKGYALLVLNPIDRKASPSSDLLRSLFDLTPAEANVARRLATGKGVETIADEGGVSVNTVRTQVRRIMAKAGCSRIAELVSLFSNIPVRRGDGDA